MMFNSMPALHMNKDYNSDSSVSGSIAFSGEGQDKDGRLVQLQPGLHVQAARQLLTLCMGDAQHIEAIYTQYAAGNSRYLYGWLQKGDLAGILGIHICSADRHEIAHLAVDPAHQHAGIGSRLIQTYRGKYAHIQLFAETDHEAVGFYRKNGFVISSLGEKYAGVERFHCVLSADC